MIQWDELRITTDGKFLVIDVEIQNLNYYNDVYLESLMMNTYSKADDFVSPMPDSKSIPIWEANEGEKIKHIRRYIDIDTIGDNLFFVYAIASGEPSEDTPCGAKDNVLVGVVYNKALLYKNSINAISSIDNCTPSKSLIDHILNTKAFELSIETGDYKSAITYWNKTFKKQVTTKTNCGCHGY